MGRDELQRWLRATPFTPFRVILRDGRHFDISHPRMNLLATTFIKIGIPAPDLRPPVCDYTEFVALTEIDRVEQLPQAAPPVAS